MKACTEKLLLILLPPFQEKTGKSPLQLLAQTCSQIGADSGSNKLLAEKSAGGSSSNPNSKGDSSSNRGSVSPNHKSSGGITNNATATGSIHGTHYKSRGGGANSPALIVSDQPHNATASPPQTITPNKDRVNFKPYEISDLIKTTTKSPPQNHGGSKPSSIVSLSPTTSPKISSSRSPGNNNHNNKSPPAAVSAATTAVNSSGSSAGGCETAPVIRSGMEVLSGHPKDIPLGTYRLPGGLDNPAFRPPFGMGSASYAQSSIAAGLAAAAASAAAGGISVCRDPYCRDPTCPTALYNAQLASLSGSAAANGLPSGYAELFKAHQMAMAMAAATAGNNSNSSGSSGAGSNSSGGGTGPYICNWMNGREGYCGKRHASAEELLQHLRTHTNLSTNDSAAASMLSPTLYPPITNSLLSGNSASAAAVAAAGLHRTYGSAAALAASRFHPYAKPGGLGGPPTAIPPSLAGLGGGLGLPPPVPPHPGMTASLAGLAAGAYSPSSLYALYGSRLAGSSILP